jgi:hypothetical protein
MPKKPEPFQPYVASNPASVAGGKFARVYVLAPSFCGVRVVERLCHMPGLQPGVRERYIPAAQLPHYKPLPEQEFPLQSLIAELKVEMLQHGATPEAVMLVGAVSPFEEKELNIMAKKLTTKPTKAKKAVKADAPKTEAKGTGGRKSSLDPKAKITITDKGAEKIAKGADNGATNNLKAMKAAKTVGKALEGDLTSADINYAARSGTITIG